MVCFAPFNKTTFMETTSSLNLLNSRIGYKKMDLGRNVTKKKREENLSVENREGWQVFCGVIPECWGLSLFVCVYFVKIGTCPKQLLNCQPR